VYSSRGDLIVSASNTSVRVWDVTSGQCRAVIQGFQRGVWDISWIEAPGVNYVATVCSDGAVGMWKMEIGEDHCHASLHWTVAKGELNVLNATIQDAKGLSELNNQLLVQRGAVGEPAHQLREASKKLAVMASVASKLKTLDKTDENPALTANASVEQLEQELVAAIVDTVRRYK
jgi:WD40 repeat protein